MRTRTILLASLMIMMSVTPLVTASFENDTFTDLNSDKAPSELIETSVDIPSKETNLEKPFELIKLEENPIRVGSSGTSGRAPCPGIQNDAGTAGDSGNTTGTAKSLGTDPTTSFQGCVDSADNADWYSLQLTQGYNIDVVMTFTATDFDLGIHNGTHWIDRDWATSGTTEKVSTAGTIVDAAGGTFYIAVNAYQGDGAYDIETWSNESLNCTDLWGTQNDAGTGGDAPENYTMSPTNMGSNVTSSYSGCADADDMFDVFAFDVPASHVIEVSMTMEDSSNDFDLYLKDSNGNQLDYSWFDNPETVTSYGSAGEGVAGTYYVNITAYAGGGNYTLDVWTNYSIPIANLVVDEINSAATTNPGDVFSVDVIVNNTGRLNVTDSYDIEVYLSTDTIVSDFDHLIGTSSISGTDIGLTKTTSVQTTIPTGIIEGTYRLFAVIDTGEVINESSDDDNEGLRNSEVTIGTVATSCGTQNDAGSVSDAGNTTTTLIDLGQPVDVEFRGCLDSNDEHDHFKINVAAGENLNITLVNAPDGDLWGDLVTDTNGSSIDSSFGLGSDDYFTTWDTDFNGTGGSFTLMLNWTDFSPWFAGGAGEYRIIIGEPEVFVPSFNCIGWSDAGIGTDAGTDVSNPMNIGSNPSLEGQGCLSDQHTSDAYQFSLTDHNNVEIMLDFDNSSVFTSSLYDANGSMVTGWVSNSSGGSWSSFDDVMYEGMDGTFTLVIESAGVEGYYNLSIETDDPAKADLAVTNLSCGEDMLSNQSITYSFDIHNLRGPAIGDFSWSLELIDSNEALVEELDSATLSTFATYGQVVLARSNTYSADSTFAENTATGIYSCRVSVNMDLTVDEYPNSVSNNQIVGENFTIQNEDELWANDFDRDGFNTTDTGDGIVDACPQKKGYSQLDRVGCPDYDGDGYSNPTTLDNWSIEEGADWDSTDETQWVDADGDGFGDNSSGTDGDQCPGVYGIEGGDGGDGCPPPFVDTDGDGVQDSDDDCPDTGAGLTVNPEDGCEFDTDGDGVVDSLDDCPATAIGVTVNPEDGCEVTDNGGGNNGDGSGDGNGGIGDGSGDGNGGTGDGSDDENGDGNTEDAAESGIDAVMIGGISGGVILIILLTLLILRKGRSNDGMADDSFANAAFNDPMMGMAASDPSITAEQLQYEQQLHAHGYTAEQARAYADQHFRPWLNQ